MFRFVALAAACLCLDTPARAQTILTYEETAARAREQAGAVVVARARILEAEAELVNASIRVRDNPIIEGSAGPRTGPGGRSTDLDVGISQQFETGGQRGARIAGAQAAIDRRLAEVDEARRASVFAAGIAFLDGIAAGERLRIAEEGDTVSRELLNTTERRYALGDIAAIDVNLARIDAARSAAALRAARAGFTEAVGRLRARLRLPAGEPIELRGSLDRPAPAPLASLRVMIDERPDFVALRADAREADAQIQLGRALQRPDLGFRVGYEREEADDIVLGGLTITLPAFQRGQGTVAGGSARASRARLELETARQTAIADLETAYALHQQRATLAATLVSEAVPSLDDNQNLARRSYEAGELNLMDLLLIRRDALETRTLMIDRRLEAARSRVEIDYLAGVLR
jgi:cobalt-zinc-cadmium efflux system outer membrane protein